MRIALYQPDIPQNTGTLLRLAACLGIDVDIIGPAGFDMSNKALRRAGLDYLDKVSISHHLSYDAFRQARKERGGRLILLTSGGSCAYTSFSFEPRDILLLGRESAGVPDHVHNNADARLFIPMQAGLRSLNIAIAGAMVLGEALRQTGGFAK